jgi:hypothetical protein
VPLLILLNLIEDVVWIFLTIAKDGAQKSLVGVYVHDQKSMSQALELQNFEVERYGVYLT